MTTTEITEHMWFEAHATATTTKSKKDIVVKVGETDSGQAWSVFGATKFTYADDALKSTNYLVTSMYGFDDVRDIKILKFEQKITVETNTTKIF
jgi:hypothetical protein